MNFSQAATLALVEVLAANRSDVSLRDEFDGDASFLDALFIANYAMSEILPHDVLMHQASIRRRHFAAFSGPASRLIVLYEGKSAGRLAIDWDVDNVSQCVDIALIPARQNLGIGGALLKAWIASSEKLGRATSLNVETSNPARRLYERLGFVAQSNQLEPFALMLRPLGG